MIKVVVYSYINEDINEDLGDLRHAYRAKERLFLGYLDEESRFWRHNLTELEKYGKVVKSSKKKRVLYSEK